MREISIEEAKGLMQEYEYAYLQMISEHILEKVINIASVNWDELIDGYIFSRDGQMHIFREEDELKAVIVDDIEGYSQIDRKYALANKYKSIGKNVIIREYLDADEDGQSFVVTSRLLGIE